MQRARLIAFVYPLMYDFRTNKEHGKLSGLILLNSRPTGRGGADRKEERMQKIIINNGGPYSNFVLWNMYNTT